MEPVTNKLRRTRLFAGLPEAGLAELIAHPGIKSGDMLDKVAAEPGDLVVLLEGGLHMTAKTSGGDHLAILAVDDGTREPAVLYTIPPDAVLQLTRSSVYLVIDGDKLDRLVSSTQEEKSLASLDDVVRRRVAALITSPPFKRLTFDHLVRCAEAMESWPAAAGEDVIVEGDVGDYFYVLEGGCAEVVRRQPIPGGAALQVPLARLTAGASFGEEALLQGSLRNATVRMVTDGRLLRLPRTDFDRLLKSELVSELAPATVHLMLQRSAADVIDCRTEEEWELWRLPGARLMPLTEIRDRARGLDPARDYVVYCRTGRRSNAAAFLMRQMGLKSHSLMGGISDWPFEVEGLPVSA
jgi:rhodanese-related sulfurtransferase